MNFSLETSGMIPRFGWIAGYTSTSPRHYVSERCSQALRRGPEPAPPNRAQKPTAEAGAAAIWRSPRRRLTLPARLPSDILTLQSKGRGCSAERMSVLGGHAEGVVKSRLPKTAEARIHLERGSRPRRVRRARGREAGSLVPHRWAV